MSPEEFALSVEKLRIQQSDDSRIEAKTCRDSLSADIWESVSAFANTEGGYIILGLSEPNNFQPVHGFSLEKVLSQFISGMGDAGTGARVANVPKYEIERHVVDGLPVLGISIEPLELSLRPCYIIDKGINTGSYKRVDDRDIRLSPTEIYAMLNVMVPSKADLCVVEGSTEEDLDNILIERLLSQAALLSPKALRNTSNQTERLIRLNVLERGGRITLAGLLLCGIYPQQFFPKAVVDVSVHAGTTKAEPGKPRFLDRVICEGPLGEVVDDAVHAVLKNLRIESVVEGAGRIDNPEIPIEVLREAIANAVIHREYSDSFMGQAVHVDIYLDRVEITNPGGLWGGKTLDNIDDGQSRCRNATLMHLASFVQLPSGGAAAEGGGTGISLIKQALLAAGMPEPELIDSYDCFTIRFSRTHTRAQLANSSGASNTSGNDKGRRRIKKDYVLTVLDYDNPKSLREIAEELNTGDDNLRAHLRNLIKDGTVVATAPATSKNRKYLRV
ncbi:MAG: putative DNA binding domain-containing protein [Atopobiaceae bacterium]|nr:putative DNA binding domain-containing protein [Atopobiaceae bacterium]